MKFLDWADRKNHSFGFSASEVELIVLGLDALGQATRRDLIALQNEIDDIERSEFETEFDLSWLEMAKNQIVTLGVQLARIRLMLNAIDEALVASKENQNV